MSHAILRRLALHIDCCDVEACGGSSEPSKQILLHGQNRVHKARDFQAKRELDGIREI
jgi:hypothetical protein